MRECLLRRQTERRPCARAAHAAARRECVIKGPFDERGDTMSTGFFTAADRERLNRFPDQIPDEDLSAFFLLSEADQQAINQHREAHTRLGFALQLCALRYLGFAPDDLTTAPAAAVEYLAHQLGVAPQALQAYGGRRPTRTVHFQQVQLHLHFRLATPLDMYALQTWLVERALEHDKPTLL